jgi:molybdopterin-guanine dinucleotide biosynthesis protein A
LFPGSLGGIYSGLSAAQTNTVFVAACDMPFINPDLVCYEAGFVREFDVVVPRTNAGLEPLHAFYSKTCLEHMGTRLRKGQLAIRAFFDDVRVREVGPDEIAQFDPDGLSFFNINTQADLSRAEEISRCITVRS